MYPEPIEPAIADKPADALRLTGEALSDGDLEAAVALYDPGAALAVVVGTSAHGTEEVRALLRELSETRLPIGVSVTREIIMGDLALVFALRTVSGRSIDGPVVALAGEGGAVLKWADAKGWRLAIDDWNLTTLGESDH
jgi:ketosteroid isomerase-like protein